MTEIQPPSPMSRTVWLFGGGVFAAAAVYVGVWLMLATGLRDLALEWIDTQRAQGWAITADDPTTQGFPGWPEVTLPSVSVTAPMEDGGWSWKTDAVTVVPTGLDLTHLTLRAPGEHLFDSPASTNGAWTLEAAQAEFQIDLSTEGKWQGATLDLGDAEIRDTFERPWMGAKRFDAHLSLTDGATTFDDVFARFTWAADDIRMGVRLGPFARTLRAIRLEADLVGPIQPGRLSEALDAWRSDGGTLEVRRFLLDWPPLAIAGDGTLALDDRLQPIGAFSTRITGFNETLESLEDDGVIPPGQSSSAQMILGLMAETPRGSDTPELAVPLSIQDQSLNVGPFELLEVPEVRWD